MLHDFDEPHELVHGLQLRVDDGGLDAFNINVQLATLIKLFHDKADRVLPLQQLESSTGRGEANWNLSELPGARKMCSLLGVDVLGEQAQRRRLHHEVQQRGV